MKNKIDTHINNNPNLEEHVLPENEFKEMILNYVGEKLNPNNEEITVEMIIDVFKEYFPEFLLCVAEENYIRGYDEATNDLKTFYRSMWNSMEN